MTDDLKPMPDVIYIDDAGRISNGYRFGTWCDEAHVEGSIKYVRAATMPSPERINVTPCTIVVGKTIFGKGISMENVQGCINRLYEAYIELKNGPTERDLTTAYMAGQMSNAPEKIDGAQEAYDAIPKLVYDPLQHETENSHILVLAAWAYDNIGTIKDALIQAGAKE